ncbi:MAG TPA: hypothetical protein VKN99_09625 [Polyangia bacterium]|nr:hypothetical protein [Polyangia bacterium]
MALALVPFLLAWLRMVKKQALLFALAFGLSMAFGCGPEPGGGGGGHVGGSGGSAGSGNGGSGGGGGTAMVAAVYAHSDSTLYKVDPDSLAVTSVGLFQWPSNSTDQMTDIAIDRDGNMIGISFMSVYAVDKSTAACRLLSMLDRSFNGLSFVPGQGPDPSAPEVLLAAALDGSVYRLDPMTGRSTPLGNFGGGLSSSGDLVSVTGFGTVATVKQSQPGNDFLARIDPATGTATVIGDTGFADVWGLGYWKGKIYGFTDGTQFVLIDPTTGAGSLVLSSSVAWWGAGVTTSAPVVP